MTVLYPNLCRIEVCYKGTALYILFTNASHFYLMQNRRRIRAGYSPNSFFEAKVGA